MNERDLLEKFGSSRVAAARVSQSANQVRHFQRVDTVVIVAAVELLQLVEGKVACSRLPQHREIGL